MLQLRADTTGINSSHIIHRVSFGPMYPGQVNPLDGGAPAPAFTHSRDLSSASPSPMHVGRRTPCCENCYELAGFRRIVEKESGTFKYFLKIVPTEYINLKREPAN